MSKLRAKLEAYDVVLADIAEKQKDMVRDEMQHEVRFYANLMLSLTTRKNQLQVHERMLKAFPRVETSPTKVEVLY